MNADRKAEAGEWSVRFAAVGGPEIRRHSFRFMPKSSRPRISFAFFASSRFVYRFCRILLLSLSPFAFALSPYLYSQSAEKTDSVYTLRLYEDLVIVDVVVTGKDGAPIKNLRQ